MRTYRRIITVVTGLFIMAGAFAQEWDDMYFTKADRKVQFTNAQFNETSSFAEEADGPVKIDKEAQLADDSYSARVINPDYIAKYKSEALDESAEAGEEETTYYDENYSTVSQNSGTYARTYNNYDPWRSSYYGNPWMYGNSWDYYNRLSWGSSMWNSWGYSPYRYGYRYNYWNDPFWGPSWGSSYGTRWSIGLSYGWGTGYYNNYYGGFSNGGYYCPPGYWGGGYYGGPVIVNNNVYIDNNTRNGRNLTYGPRSSRTTSTAATQNTNRYRNTQASSPDLTPVDANNATGRTASTNPQGSYYRRSRTSDASNVRTSQRSRTTAVTSGQSLNEVRQSSYDYSRSGRTSSATTNYSRSRSAVTNNPAVPSYTNSRANSSVRTSSSRPSSAATRTSSFNRSTNRSSTGSTYRTTRGSSYNRSSGSTGRSYSSGSSGSSYSSGSRSFSSGGGSRSSVSSGGGSRSSSSGGASRSSAGGGGRRGGN